MGRMGKSTGNVSRVTEAVLKECTPKRTLFDHKTSNGTVCVIAGGKSYHGAAVLASNAVENIIATLRVGIGYAILYVPASIQNTCRKLSPNVIVKQFGTQTIGQGNLSSLKVDIARSNCIAIGMGIGRDEKTLRKAASIIKHTISMGKKVIVDGDAIYSISYIRELGQNVLLTPQDKEFEELSGHMPELRQIKKRQADVKKLAAKLNCNVLLKGHNTLISNGSKIAMVSAKSSALATMGTGDVLSGIIAAYAASGVDIFKAACAGSYLHAKIGDKLHLQMGNHIIASDIVDAIPRILKKYDR